MIGYSGDSDYRGMDNQGSTVFWCACMYICFLQLSKLADAVCNSCKFKLKVIWLK